MKADPLHYSLDEMNVLLIDDNWYMRSLVRSILNSLGTENVCEANDVNEGFQETQNFDADLIIVNWTLGPLTGLDFVHLIRTSKESPAPYIPIIIMSADATRQRVLDARDASVNEFLAKPISPKTLYQRIASLISNPRPFILGPSYNGPCRRRKNLSRPGGLPERRKLVQ